MKDYVIVENRDVASLQRDVNDMIRQGWEPRGGIALARPSSSLQMWRFFQAMVRESGPDELLVAEP
ncbi:MAG: DUF1737 domain-containing protein [Patescibacteria group bacterium]|nr:DUF1737 domain-containing protein [Patescibacteria group bacterium]